jgi:cyclic beta-1,2-glucan synthetase
MGSGDWNDGMNRVGAEGRGESVWLAWFLIAALRDFAQVCALRGDAGLSDLLRQRAAKLAQAVEAHAWDGAWYLRAFYDDGTPLGSATNRECQIDAIAQSWAVLSGAGQPGRARQAMQAVSQRLVRPQDRLVLLFTPPFDRTPHDPGYIKGYLPGIRENGGQYTHASIWTAWAFARLGDGDAACRLFELLNPIYHADSPEKAARYKVEPYAIAADVYSVAPHTGRGGWTWYTGSAGWMYRLGVEAILGLHLEGDELSLQPCIPASWPGYQMELRHGKTKYAIRVENPDGVSGGVVDLALDGEVVEGGKIRLVDDGQPHQVRVRLGS